MGTLVDKIVFILCARFWSSSTNHVIQLLSWWKQYFDSELSYEQCPFIHIHSYIRVHTYETYTRTCVHTYIIRDMAKKISIVIYLNGVRVNRNVGWMNEWMDEWMGSKENTYTVMWTKKFFYSHVIIVHHFFFLYILKTKVNSCRNRRADVY